MKKGVWCLSTMYISWITLRFFNNKDIRSNTQSKHRKKAVWCCYEFCVGFYINLHQTILQWTGSTICFTVLILAQRWWYLILYELRQWIDLRSEFKYWSRFFMRQTEPTTRFLLLLFSFFVDIFLKCFLLWNGLQKF